MKYSVGQRVRFTVPHLWGTLEGTVNSAFNGIYWIDIGEGSAYGTREENIIAVIESEPTAQLNLFETSEQGVEETERDRMRAFFFGQSPKLPTLAESWKSEGKCPLCGEDGRIHLSTFICSKHGPY